MIVILVVELACTVWIFSSNKHFITDPPHIYNSEMTYSHFPSNKKCGTQKSLKIPLLRIFNSEQQQQRRKYYSNNSENIAITLTRETTILNIRRIMSG